MVDQDLKAIVAEIERKVLAHTCLNCQFFDEYNELCNIYYKRPPARVIVEGCEKHLEKTPF